MTTICRQNHPEPAYNVAMICNIDAKGRRIRGVSGWACLIIGIGMIVCGLVWRDMLWPLLISGAILGACGGFQIFESLKGWCAFRAMGMKTPW
jgi:uncharacterized membrane protein HdeD (DUF308 family)